MFNDIVSCFVCCIAYVVTRLPNGSLCSVLDDCWDIAISEHLASLEYISHLFSIHKNNDIRSCKSRQTRNLKFYFILSLNISLNFFFILELMIRIYGTYPVGWLLWHLPAGEKKLVVYIIRWKLIVFCPAMMNYSTINICIMRSKLVNVKVYCNNEHMNYVIMND